MSIIMEAEVRVQGSESSERGAIILLHFLTPNSYCLLLEI